ALRYQLPNPGRVQLAVYDVTGKVVKVLVDEEKKPGSYEVPFIPEGKNGIPAGVYFARLNISTGSGSNWATKLRLVKIQ
ncbi:MAG: T9SS type A sorting domain-containing protein, partial [candidate division WOR-3 bacterium]